MGRTACGSSPKRRHYYLTQHQEFYLKIFMTLSFKSNNGSHGEILSTTQIFTVRSRELWLSSNMAARRQPGFIMEQRGVLPCFFPSERLQFACVPSQIGSSEVSASQLRDRFGSCSDNPVAIPLFHVSHIYSPSTQIPSSPSLLPLIPMRLQGHTC